MCHSIFLVEVLVAHFKSATFAASLEKEVTKEKGPRDVSNNVVMKAFLRKSLSNTHTAMKRKADDVLFQLFRKQGQVSRLCVRNDMDLPEKKEEVTQAEA